ncbi:MAG: flagellar biosynthesis anti-sigma factor FlgM [Steroidobacteraceae bacterium]|jgi:negative regulator of flagellin synthesis FlgM|nr:flagellar biosynthesis anti-sigma factor FlgM [Steroidobacteraceae bacterium]
MSKIQGYGTQPPVVTGGNRTSATERTGGEIAKVEKAAPARDSVTLTDSARSLQKLAEAVAAAPVVSESRVESIKNAIAQGKYEVNAERVAEKMLAAGRELPGR